MEMYWNSEPKVATNVFELGLKMFGSEPDYILRYLDFLLLQNNANSAFPVFRILRFTHGSRLTMRSSRHRCPRPV